VARRGYRRAHLADRRPCLRFDGSERVRSGLFRIAHEASSLARHPGYWISCTWRTMSAMGRILPA